MKLNEQPRACHQEWFAVQYEAVRQQPPMRWMSRMFVRLAEGMPPQLVDLPTGAGKTDIIVVWLLALAWYAQDRVHRSPIPRRMVWVVNRRVLVQQVFDLADRIQGRMDDASEELRELRASLRSLCRDARGPCFRVVQLRGQLVDDREWSLDPSIPQLIIGTVDQIGSKLLFQGYGQGKWSRPLHAALLGVDAWVCIDEAHLVPEFALTLRQIRGLAATPMRDTAAPSLSAVFAKLPFWATELSATPALPRPSCDTVFSIIDEDHRDDLLANRLLAARMRQVRFDWIEDQKKLADELVAKAIEAATGAASIAVFCQTVATAQKVAQALGRRCEFKGRVLTVTGRLRGYERDRLKDHPVFRRFRRSEVSDDVCKDQPSFLVGTAAAEVGLDADADAVVCDFAPLQTLLQRLGRLDRRGVLSKRAKNGCAAVPAMTIIVVKPGVTAGGEGIVSLARNLKEFGLNAEFFAGTAWREVADKPGVAPTVNAATWAVLRPNPESQIASPPLDWLKHDLAPVTSGPLVVPPLAPTVLGRWAATTPHSSPYLPVHPWLYGLLPNDEGTPLVGIAFRVEMDLLQHEPPSSGEEEAPSLAANVMEVIQRFPPLRAELHFVPLAAAREWLHSPATSHLRIACFDDGEWTMFGNTTLLRSDAVLVLPTSTDVALLEELIQGNTDLQTVRGDVFEAVSTNAAFYRRKIAVSGSSDLAAYVRPDLGVHRFGTKAEEKSPASADSTAVDTDGWRPDRLRLKGEVEGLAVVLTYFRRVNSSQPAQLLSEHQTTAEASAGRLADALAPSHDFLKRLLRQCGAGHDRGKDHPKWQRAMGNSDLRRPVAKALMAQPASTDGYRHEWGSLLKAEGESPDLPAGWDDATRRLWLDLWRHLIAAHHGYFRPSMPDRGFAIPPTPSKQSPLRLQAMERFAHLQQVLGPWRLAYLESLLKASDVDASREAMEDQPDES